VLDDLLEEIEGLSAKGFLVDDPDELLKLRRDKSFNWIATSANVLTGQALQGRDMPPSFGVHTPTGRRLVSARSALPKVGVEAALIKNSLDDAFLKLGSITYAGTGAKARNLKLDNSSARNAGRDKGSNILPGGNAVFRAGGSGQNAIELVTKLNSIRIAANPNNAILEDEELRRRGGGGSSEIALVPRGVNGGASARVVEQKRITQQMAARAAIAAGAQPVVIKIISTVSSKGSANTLMEYLGTRETEMGIRENIPVFNHFGNSIDDAIGRAVLVAEWTQTFKEPYSVSCCVTVLLEMKNEASDAVLHQSLGAAFEGKPFVYSRDGNTVEVYGVTELVAGRLNAEIKARTGGNASQTYLVKAESKIVSALAASGFEAGVTIKGATATETSARYYLEKFLRTHAVPVSSKGEPVRIEDNAHNITKQMFAEWQPHLKVVHPRNAFHVVFSGRAGTDAKAMVRAVSEFLGSQIPDHKWVIAHHAETGHVHIHAMIAARDAFGKPLRFTKPELFEWRENFADVARAHGIAMVATRRADMAATRPFTQNQVGAYERAKSDPTYTIQASTRLRVEAKRDGRADLVAVKSDKLALVERWQRTAELLKSDFPELQSAYQTVSDFIASVQWFRRSKVAEGQATPAPAAEPINTARIADVFIATNSTASAQLLSNSIQTEIQEFFDMALSAAEARVRIDAINRNFDQAAQFVPLEKRSDFVVVRQSVSSKLEARYSELAKKITPERQQINEAIALYGRRNVVEGIGVMVEVEAVQKRLELAVATNKDKASIRQELDFALVKAACLALEGNSYLREIAKSDAALARAIDNAEREIAAKSTDNVIQITAKDTFNADPQDQQRLNQINATREIHPIAQKQLAEKLAAEQREKILQEQKSKVAERAKLNGKDKDQGR
jgi:Relaxase/Mobilisation nuclease domain